METPSEGHIEEQILRYPDLPPEEQKAVEAHVDGHPRWQTLLRDVKALETLLAQARSSNASPSAEALAHYLATPDPAEAPPALKSTFDAVEAALQDEEHGPELRARAEAMTRRLRTLEAENQDPAAHFEALTGHRISAEALSEERPAATASAEKTRRAVQLWTLLRLASLPRWARYGSAFVLALVLLYGALFAGGRLAQSDMERLASLDEDRLSIEGYGLSEMRTRGAEGGPAQGDSSASLDTRYLRGLRLLREAHTAPLGLFPRYDETPVRRAEEQLEAVSREADDGSFVQLEALFFLGKARLALGQKARATQAFRQVVASDGRLAPEAQRILETLHEDAAYDGPPAN